MPYLKHIKDKQKRENMKSAYHGFIFDVQSIFLSLDTPEEVKETFDDMCYMLSHLRFIKDDSVAFKKCMEYLGMVDKEEEDN